jgi:hypothetical protein
MLNKCKASYLGDKIFCSGTVDETIHARSMKAIGACSQIISILKSVTLGSFYFQTALLLRDTMFINCVLTSSEVWPLLTEKTKKNS